MGRYFFPVLTCGARIIKDYFTFMRPCSKENKKMPLEKRYKKAGDLLYFVSKHLHVDFHIEGLENLPKDYDGPLFFCGDHTAFIDPFPFFIFIKKPTSFVAKKEIDKMPFIPKFLKCVDGLTMDRNDLRQSLKILREVENDFKEKKEHNWVIFPEGTRNKDYLHNLQEFKSGSFKPALLSNVPIVPVAIYGTYRVLKFKPHYKRYPVFFKILKPIMPDVYKDLSTNEVSMLCEKEIQKALTYDLRIKDKEEMLKYNKKKYTRF